MRPKRARLRAAVPVAVCAVACAACASSGNTDPGTTPAAPQTSAIAPNKVVPFDPADNVRSDVAVTACAPAAGSWVASGTVTNPGATRSFRLVVDFTSVPGSTVLSSTVVTIPDVKAHSTVPWSASGARGHSDVACLLRQAQAP